jgi:lysophospholipase L1-like esterase
LIPTKYFNAVDFDWRSKQSSKFLTEYKSFSALLEEARVRDRGPDVHFTTLQDFIGSFITVEKGVRNTVRLSELRDTDAVPLKVILLGGSTVFCAEVQDSETLPSQLQASLESQEVACRVVNSGMPGATSSNRLHFAKELSDLASFDVVILYTGINDCELAHRYRKKTRRTSSSYYLRLATGILSNFRSLHRYLKDVCTPSVIEFMEDKSHDNQLRLTILQPHLGTYRPTATRLVNSAILKISAESRIRRRLGYFFLKKSWSQYEWFFDLTDSLNGEHETYVDLAHLTAKGNKVMADEIARVICFSTGKLFKQKQSFQDELYSERQKNFTVSIITRAILKPNSVRSPETDWEPSDPFNYPLF